MAVDLFHRLQTEYRGHTILAPNIGSWMMNDSLAFALTGGRAIRVSNIDATPSDVQRYDALRDQNGMLTYICLDTVYLRQRRLPDAVNLCDLAVESMVPRGHQIVADGPGWLIMQIGRERALAADKTDLGSQVVADRALAGSAPAPMPR